jgi:TOMM system kinase/cyclase fusion protein
MNEINKPSTGDSSGASAAGDGSGEEVNGSQTLRTDESPAFDLEAGLSTATVGLVEHAERTARNDLQPEWSESGASGTAPVALPTFGRYETHRLLGNGGYGAVYLGYDNHLHRAVAIKVPHNPSAALEQRFLDEARQLAQLRHPGIVTVHDVGVQDEQCYIVSDYLPGSTLREWQQQRRPTWPEAARIAAALANALAHAHALRVVHRDLKPDNVVLVSGRDPVIVDFGIAVSDVAPGNARRGQIIGTPAYMAPEQASGEGHRIDGRTDIYALGVILYEMLTGRQPFKGRNPHDVLLQIIRDAPQPPRQLNPEIPPLLEQICLKAMAKNIADRYTTAADVDEELRALLQRATGKRKALEPGALAPQSRPASKPASKPAQPLPPTPRSSSESTPQTRRSREAERRQVTLLQATCDVFTSNELAARLQTDEQVEVLRQFQELCRSVIAYFEGTVVQATEHGLLVCFGYPVAFEDATRRAVRAALALLSCMTAFNQRLMREHKVTLSAAAAIHTDLAVIEQKSADGEAFSLVGRLRNVAAQLVTAAEPGTAVISGSALRLVKGFVDCERVEGVSGPGNTGKPGTDGEEIYRIVRERSYASRMDVTAAIGLTPLTGRDQEVELLKGRWEQAAEGMGQMVLLIGEAGLGKSRLVHELKSHVRRGPQAQGIVIEWRCTPHHQNSTLYPAVEYLERALRLRARKDSEDRLQALLEHMQKLGMTEDEDIALMAALLSLPPNGRFIVPELSRQAQKQKTLTILRDWLRANAAQQPVLFIVEDLHWVDPTTLEFLTAWVESGFQDRILTLLTFRPAFETPWKSKAHQTQMALNRLTNRQTGQMVAAQLGVKEVPGALIERIVERTDGVPLFIEELTTMIKESGKLRQQGGELDVAASLMAGEIPATLQDLLMARLDRMAGNIEVVQLAATIGREFTHDLILDVSPLPGAELHRELDTLVEAGILFRQGRLPAVRYVFKHALLQEAAYQSLVKKRRQQFHQRIAMVLEQQDGKAPASRPELLAHHFTEAGMIAEATQYWHRAGDSGLERCAYNEAISHLTRGLELVPNMAEGPERDQLEIKMHVSLGVALQSVKGYSSPEVEASYARAYALCSQMGLDTHLFPVLSGLFRYCLLQAKYTEARRLGEQLVALAEKHHSPSLVVAAHRALAAPLVYQGEHARALVHLREVVDITATPELRAESYVFDVVDPWVAARSYLSWSLLLTGQLDQAMDESRQAIAIAEGLEHPFSLALALSFAGCLHQFRRDADATRQVAERALAVATEHGYAFWIGWNRVLHGWTLSARGQHRDAIAEIRRGLVEWHAQGSELGRHYYLVLLADAHRHAGELDQARDALRHAREFSDSTGEVFWTPELHRSKGELALAAGAPVHEVEAHYTRALELAHQQQAWLLALRAATSLARLWQQHGRNQAARALLADVCAWLQDAPGTQVLQQQARALLAELG